MRQRCLGSPLLFCTSRRVCGRGFIDSSSTCLNATFGRCQSQKKIGVRPRLLRNQHTVRYEISCEVTNRKTRFLYSQLKLECCNKLIYLPIFKLKSVNLLRYAKSAIKSLFCMNQTFLICYRVQYIRMIIWRHRNCIEKLQKQIFKVF